MRLPTGVGGLPGRRRLGVRFARLAAALGGFVSARRVDDEKGGKGDEEQRRDGRDDSGPAKARRRLPVDGSGSRAGSARGCGARGSTHGGGSGAWSSGCGSCGAGAGSTNGRALLRRLELLDARQRTEVIALERALDEQPQRGRLAALERELEHRGRPAALGRDSHHTASRPSLSSLCGHAQRTQVDERDRELLAAGGSEDQAVAGDRKVSGWNRVWVGGGASQVVGPRASPAPSALLGHLDAG